MTPSTSTTRFRFWLCLIRLFGVIVPRRLQADWSLVVLLVLTVALDAALLPARRAATVDPMVALRRE